MAPIMIGKNFSGEPDGRANLGLRELCTPATPPTGAAGVGKPWLGGVWGNCGAGEIPLAGAPGSAGLGDKGDIGIGCAGACTGRGVWEDCGTWTGRGNCDDDGGGDWGGCGTTEATEDLDAAGASGATEVVAGGWGATGATGATGMTGGRFGLGSVWSTIPAYDSKLSEIPTSHSIAKNITLLLHYHSCLIHCEIFCTRPARWGNSSWWSYLAGHWEF